MRLYVNDKPFDAPCGDLTVADLVRLQQLPPVGLAVAVNNKVIRKADWPSTCLSADDHVTVITAVCGG